MVQVWLSLSMAAGMMLPAEPVQVQFVRSMPSREVMVCLDGEQVKTTTAGKLGFRDASSTWTSLCADVRSPVTPRQIFRVRPVRTRLAGGNVAKAGNIVAKHFRAAQTADQCAALQLAVWEAIEDGGGRANFAQGRFQARATTVVIAMAEQYYEAIELPAEAWLLQTGSDGGQDQIFPVN